MIKKQFISNQELIQEIQNGSLLLTGNLRLSRVIKQQVEQFILASGLEVWSTPQIFPWSTWIKQSWEECVLNGFIPAPDLLLSAEQERLVWKQLISESEQWNGLLRLNATAKKIQAAWDLLNGWNVELQEDDVAGNIDAEVFLLWLEQFKKICADNNWLSASLMVQQLANVYTESDAKLVQKKIILLGFDELSPQQNQLLSNLHIDVLWCDFPPKQPDNSVKRLACLDYRDEIQYLSRWVRQHIETNQDKNSDFKIAVIVPELAKYRQVIIHALNLTLAPKNLSPEHGYQQEPFNISLGKPLAEYALVRAAFMFLALFKPNSSAATNMENISCLLRSPFMHGWAVEANQRALLDRRLRKKRLDKISLKQLIYYAGESGKNHYSPVLQQGLLQASEFLKKLPVKANCKVWAVQFGQLLKVVGWTKGRTLSSEEFQVNEAWIKLLGKLSAMAAVSGELDGNSALSLLQSLAMETLFQPQSKNDSSIQVMGLYEATGLQFNALWIMGLHDAIWPAKANPDNFIPLPLQRDLNMPHSSAGRELEVAKKITERLKQSANEVIFSYPGIGEQNEELAASPLIEMLELIDKPALDLPMYPSWAEIVASTGTGMEALERIEDDMAPAIQDSKVAGGTSLFKYQAACPFRAFAEFRLKARAFEKSEPGLDAMQRGGLVHKALELAWLEIKDHQHLLELQQKDQLDGILQRVIEAALVDIQEEYQQSMGQRFLTIETQRIKKQLLQWFELEAQRAPFAIDRLEQQLQSEINGILVDIVIDRIDILPDGRRVLIDYKTGGIRPSQWFGERPEEPQLPLYNSVVHDAKAAVLFGQLKAGEIAYKGIVAETHLIPDLPPKYGDRIIKEAAQRWDEILQGWLLTLQKLAGDFRQGRAEVDPKQIQQSCQYCQLSALCRIDELNVLNNNLITEECMNDQ